MTGIYKITEIATGLCYIGQSIHCHAQKGGRWKEHHKRFPPALFTYEVLIQCPEESLNFFEKSFISGYDSHRNGFNKTIGGTSIKATHPDAETREKMGAGNRGKTMSPETRAKISAANKGQRIGMPSGAAGNKWNQSPEAKEKIRIAQQGKKRGKYNVETA